MTMPAVTPVLKSSSFITRRDKPILTHKDIPYPATLIFNAGVVKYNGKYVMVFRNDYGCTEESFANGDRFKGTSVGIAVSDNGIDNWVVREKPLIDSCDINDKEISRYYDPRITLIDGKPYLCLAMDTEHGIRGAIAEVDDNFESFNIISTTVPDNRNMALFPEKIGDRYVRLERPFPVYGRWGKDRFDVWMSKSPDLRYWGDTSLLLGVEDVPFANDKLGPAAPPVKTEKGWLTLFHAVDIDESRGKNGWEKVWKKRYTAGIMLLDKDDPSKVIGFCKEPLIAPETEYEVNEGFRQNVIFPCGMVLEDSGEVKIYYGASDTVTCLATADVNDLLSLCIK
ncbi:MAG: glycoside hydrolase family 130 protein [Clostridia bacterium]|nr:glycoside hydrolase family 130 protein [Clostridia bacterium]